jgi:hypothetical protein
MDTRELFNTVRTVPKPEPRGKKPRKPIRRSAIKRRVTKDPAAIRQADVFAVYGFDIRCVFTTARVIELHHILGRGELFGIKMDDLRRELLSSVFNVAPLIREIHQGPLRDNRYMRHMFLGLAEQRVMNAVGAGQYTLTDIDRGFLALAKTWKRKNPC